MDLFERQWATYRILVEQNLMEHREISDATSTAIRHWLGSRTQKSTPIHMVDLGCGDLGQLAPLLRTLPLGQYVGLDITEAVLPLAQHNLGSVPYPCLWEQGDLLNWACATQRQRVDLIHTSFALHHLDEAQKGLFLHGARRRIRANGLFLWVDVFQRDDETRWEYLERYGNRVKQWPGLSKIQRDSIVRHIERHDWPAKRGWLEQQAEKTGWSLSWAWNGQHEAEAIALLQPIENQS